MTKDRGDRPPRIDRAQGAAGGACDAGSARREEPMSLATLSRSLGVPEVDRAGLRCFVHALTHGGGGLPSLPLELRQRIFSVAAA